MRLRFPAVAPSCFITIRRNIKVRQHILKTSAMFKEAHRMHTSRLRYTLCRTASYGISSAVGSLSARATALKGVFSQRQIEFVSFSF